MPPSRRGADCAAGASSAAGSAASPKRWRTPRARPGPTIRTGAEVERILTRDGRAAGVRLTGGEEIACERVLSNADPKRTFLGLLGEDELPGRFVASLRAYRCNGTSVKINLGVDRLPEVTGMPSGRQPYLGGIMEFGPFIAGMDRAQAEAREGRLGRDPHTEVCIPTFHDPSLAPEGKHVLTIDVNSQPYDLDPAEGSWDELKDRVADEAVARLETYMPGLTDSIEQRQVLSPLDLERLLGISGGHALHGDMAFDQLFTLRPVRGWADYRTPVEGLWLCGAGTHPGGGVSGANGRNCAREVIRDGRGGLVREAVGALVSEPLVSVFDARARPPRPRPDRAGRDRRRRSRRHRRRARPVVRRQRERRLAGRAGSLHRRRGRGDVRRPLRPRDDRARGDGPRARPGLGLRLRRGCANDVARDRDAAEGLRDPGIGACGASAAAWRGRGRRVYALGQ